MLRRLHELKAEMEKENQERIKQFDRPFGEVSQGGSKGGSSSPYKSGYIPTSSGEDISTRVNSVKMKSPRHIPENSIDGTSISPSTTPTKRNLCNSPRSQSIYDPGRFLIWAT